MLSYEPLWKTLITKKLKKTDLVTHKIISSSTLAKLGKDEYVNTKIYDKICKFLNCEIEDIVKYIPDEE